MVTDFLLLLTRQTKQLFRPLLLLPHSERDRATLQDKEKVILVVYKLTHLFVGLVLN